MAARAGHYLHLPTVIARFMRATHGNQLRLHPWVARTSRAMTRGSDQGFCCIGICIGDGAGPGAAAPPLGLSRLSSGVVNCAPL
jgi:hypothetical protein